MFSLGPSKSEACLKDAAEAKSIPALCLEAGRKHAKHDALNYKSGRLWMHISSEEFATRVRHVACGLMEIGLKAGDHVALLSENRPEWSIVDLAILSLGAVNVPIYTTQAIDQVRFILEDSNACMLFVSGHKLFKRARPGIAGVEAIDRIIFFESEVTSGIQGAITLDSLERRGIELELQEPWRYAECLDGVGSGDLATIIYTSGTTGEPKGAMLTHGSFISNINSITNGLPINPSDTALSVLPLSHIFERTCFYVFCWNGVSIYYAPSFDQLGDHLRDVRPTIMTAVPRLFEKVFHRIVKSGTSGGGFKRTVFSTSLSVGQRYARLKDKAEAIPPLLEIQQNIANRFIFSKWRSAVGGRLRYFVSGGAPLSPSLSYAFLAAGIPVLQGYGMTETCVVSANRPWDNRVGSVGVPFRGIDVSLSSEGEILVRGPNVMLGYYGNAEATSAAIHDGWYATGDIGQFDEHGHLYLTDRKKDLFKLSNGKYIAPQMIESLIKESSLVNQVVIVGEGRKHPAALIVPDWEGLKAALSMTRPPRSRVEISADPRAIKLIQRNVASLTSDLSEYERIRRVALLPDEFSIDGGELTPTLKVKRGVVEKKYESLIESLYGRGLGSDG